MILQFLFLEIRRFGADSEIRDFLLIGIIVLQKKFVVTAFDHGLVSIRFWLRMLVWIEDVPTVVADFEHVWSIAGAFWLWLLEAMRALVVFGWVCYAVPCQLAFELWILRLQASVRLCAHWRIVECGIGMYDWSSFFLLLFYDCL